MDDFDKCYFCQSYDTYDGCQDGWCECREDFKPNKNRIIEEAKSRGLSVADVIALINL